VRGLLVVTSLILAWLTTVLIERPVQLGAQAKWKLVLPCVLMIGVGYLGGMTYARGGLGFRKGYSPDADVRTATLGAGGEFVDHTCGVSPDDQKLFISARPTGVARSISPYGATARPMPSTEDWSAHLRPTSAGC